MASFSINPACRLGAVHLNVANLEAASAFYCDRIGMKLLFEDGQIASLGAGGRELLRLVEVPGAKKYQGRTGLYHFCIGVDQRLELARLLRRLLDSSTPLDGLVDHRMADAIYLTDPEGNGIELNWDHPRDSWPPFSDIARLGNGRLDVEELLGLLDKAGRGDGRLPADARISHIHLHVADLALSSDFYHKILGLDINFEFKGQAVFTSAGGYHHHVAFNIWNGLGASPPPADATGLKTFTLLLPDAASLEKENARLKEAGVSFEITDEGTRVKDPSQNGLLLRTP